PGARIGLVTDERVAATYREPVEARLREAGLSPAVIAVPPGEASKRMAVLESVVSDLLDARIERGDIVLALGGGVVGDLAGFAAAILRRGVRLVQVPTSLLAQVDSSVGGKTGINASQGKNLIGAFHQPALVLIDPDVLDTLDPRQVRAGYAEIAKYGLIDDPAFFAWLEENGASVIAGDAGARARAIATACEAKARVVAADERESGQRALLNLGHTFGHALEAATGYSDRLLHGEGVAIGMVLAHRFSARLGLAPAADAARVEAHLTALGLPTEIGDIPGPALAVGDLLHHIAQDKKVERGTLTFILTRGIGQAFVARDVAEADVSAFLTESLAHARAA
ncbi:MAG: 3-dehydroquinate synthase, partial [Pseudomonadota bacterium]